MPTLIRSRFGVLEQQSFDFSGGGRTKQAPAESCDINAIMARYNRTGVFPAFRDGGAYGDVSELTSYEDALALTERVESDFASLPSAVRARFAHSIPAFLDFLADPANRDEAIKLGLVAPAAESVPGEAKKEGDKNVAQG